jgi:uncharacterized protein (DUF2062 family)
VRALGLPLVVVDDGSTDDTRAILASSVAASDVTVVTRPRNRGKGAALRTGFAAAADAGFTHAVTIDTDGQHDAAEIPRLLARAREAPDALMIGHRDESAPGYPARSLLGRRLSNLFIRMESGVRVGDSQCGMRVYPLGLVAAVRARAGRFGFETEIVTRAGWAGCAVLEVPVACRYLPPGERVSHLRPVVDTLRAIGMHARLLARAMSPWPRHPRWPARPESVGAAPRRSLARRLLDWLNPAEAWRQVRRDHVSREQFAAGLAVGAFIGNLPTYGLHAFIGLYAAKRLHLHPLAVLVGSHISTPPLGPLLNAAAIALGHLILHGGLPSGDDYNVRDLGFLEVLRRMLLEWCVGSPIVGLACAVVVFVVSTRLLRLAAARDTTESRADRPGGPAPGHAA